MPATFEHVAGFFHQDVLAPLYAAETALDRSFGLLEESPDRWPKFIAKLKAMNEEAPAGVSYKMIWFGRHGQGFHNVAEVKYSAEGTWEHHWGKLNTDGNIVWGPDPLLTSIGEGQARAISAAWETQLPLGIPVPTRWFVSPLTRTCNTLTLSMASVWGPEGAKGKGVRVLENLREVCGMHTCDKRSPLSVTRQRFPNFVTEVTEDRNKGCYSEDDTYWNPIRHETDEEQQSRMHAVFSEVWEYDDLAVSLTAHAGIMRAAFAVLNHPLYKIVTGELVPMVVMRKET